MIYSAVIVCDKYLSCTGGSKLLTLSFKTAQVCDSYVSCASWYHMSTPYLNTGFWLTTSYGQAVLSSTIREVFYQRPALFKTSVIDMCILIPHEI